MFFLRTFFLKIRCFFLHLFSFPFPKISFSALLEIYVVNPSSIQGCLLSLVANKNWNQVWANSWAVSSSTSFSIFRLLLHNAVLITAIYSPNFKIVSKSLECWAGVTWGVTWGDLKTLIGRYEISSDLIGRESVAMFTVT